MRNKIERFSTKWAVILWGPTQCLVIQAMFIEMERLMVSPFLFFMFIVLEILIGIYIIPILIEYWRIRKQVNKLMRKIK